MVNKLRARNRLPYDFEDGLLVKGSSVENMLIGARCQLAGDGVTTVFPLTVTPYNKDTLDVFVKQLYVHPDDYSLQGNVITFVEPPPPTENGEAYNVFIRVSVSSAN